MKFYRDDSNTARAEAEGDLSFLAAFFESDIQEDKDSAIELLQYLEARKGSRTGNAFEAAFDDKYVTLTELHGAEESVQIGRNIFFQAVEAWIVFIGD